GRRLAEAGFPISGRRSAASCVVDLWIQSAVFRNEDGALFLSPTKSARRRIRLNNRPDFAHNETHAPTGNSISIRASRFGPDSGMRRNEKYRHLARQSLGR